MSKTLLKNLKDKPVIVMYYDGDAVSGVLLDVDKEMLHLSGDDDIYFSVNRNYVKAIYDAQDAIEGFDDEKDILQ